MAGFRTTQMNEIVVALIGLAGIALSNLITGLVTYKVGASNARAAERLASAEAQKSVNDAFRLLVDTFQEDRRVMRDEITEMKAEVHALGEDIVLLTRHVERLELEIVKDGKVVPPRPVRQRLTARA